eukprot:GHVQ01006243.1.p1 GENE.GHVQ01006243.1~~GHVQ01006243.1.p1  ORF type:complete len:296 (+),score=40.87 GHVQ01006243.1:3-890(+)
MILCGHLFTPCILPSSPVIAVRATSVGVRATSVVHTHTTHKGPHPHTHHDHRTTQVAHPNTRILLSTGLSIVRLSNPRLSLFLSKYIAFFVAAAVLLILLCSYGWYRWYFKKGDDPREPPGAQPNTGDDARKPPGAQPNTPDEPPEGVEGDPEPQTVPLPDAVVPEIAKQPVTPQPTENGDGRPNEERDISEPTEDVRAASVGEEHTSPEGTNNQTSSEPAARASEYRSAQPFGEVLSGNLKAKPKATDLAVSHYPANSVILLTLGLCDSLCVYSTHYLYGCLVFYCTLLVISLL